jgi:hypothetical protein
VHELVILDSGGSQLDTRATRARVCMSVAVHARRCASLWRLSRLRSSRVVAARGLARAAACWRKYVIYISYFHTILSTDRRTCASCRCDNVHDTRRDTGTEHTHTDHSRPRIAHDLEDLPSGASPHGGLASADRENNYSGARIPSMALCGLVGGHSRPCVALSADALPSWISFRATPSAVRT